MDILTGYNGILLAKSEVVIAEPGFDQGVTTEEGVVTDVMGTAVKDPLLSSWPFVIGISAAVLAISVAIGVLLAKRKIKKGIELYED